VPVLEENVFRLDVAVNHAEPVRICERVSDFARNRERIVDRQLSLAFEACAECFAGHERHHVVEQSTRFAAVE
jgi:hypothetical protein